MSYASVTAIGKDRVGIVEEISGFLSNLGLNIEESRMALLGGEFAGIVLVSGEEEAVHRLQQDCEAFGHRARLTVRVTQTHAAEHEAAGRPYRLTAYSLDTPGLVHAVTRVLRTLNVNIEDLESDVASAPWTGAPMFRMEAQVVVPSATTVVELKEALSTLEASRDIDIRLEPITSHS